MSRRKPNEEYDKTMAGRFFGWLSGSKDPYLGQVEMQAQAEKVLPSETIIERMREAQMRRDKVYDPESNTLARLFHKIYTTSAILFCIALVGVGDGILFAAQRQRGQSGQQCSVRTLHRGRAAGDGRAQHRFRYDPHLPGL